MGKALNVALLCVVMACAVAAATADTDTNDAADETVADETVADAADAADATDAADAMADKVDDSWAAITSTGGGAQLAAANVNTDGNLHWLRNLYLHFYPTAPVAGQEGTLLVGDPAATAGDAVIDHAHTHPSRNPVVTRQALSDWYALRPLAQLVLTHTAPLWNDPCGVQGMRCLRASPVTGYTDLRVQHCDSTIIDALIAMGKMRAFSDKSDKNCLTLALRTLFSGDKFSKFDESAYECDIGIPLARAKAVTAFLAVQTFTKAQQTLMNDHYARFQEVLTAVHNGQNFDIWELRGWLYATDRSMGHRLMGAMGWAHAPAGTDIPDDASAWERDYIHGKLQAGGGGAHNTWGTAGDTIGHVRPKMFGGERDPMNFVPQSRIGQKIVGTAETLAKALYDNCLDNSNARQDKNVRYHLVFTYPAAPNGNAHQRPLRPSAVRVAVDLVRDCTSPQIGGTLAKGKDVYKYEGSTY